MSKSVSMSIICCGRSWMNADCVGWGGVSEVGRD